MSRIKKALQAKSRIKLCRGLTLVELLVVVGVISVVTAIVLPSVKTILTDRKSSQTAIVVKNFFEAARARAIGKNKTVAVVLERVSSRVDPLSGPGFVSATAQTVPPAALASQPLDFNFVPYNTCIRLSLAEEPLPVTDSMLPTSISIQARAPSDGFSPSIPTSGAYSGMDSLLDADQIAGIAEVRIFSVTPGFAGFNVSSLLGEYLVSGSQISFGNSKRRFTIVSPRNPAVHISHAAATGQIWFSVMNEEGLEGLGERALEPPEPLVAGQISSAFKIYPRPKPIYSEMVQLPRGMCIDLSLSGFSNDSLRNSTAASPNKQRVYDPVLTPNPTPMSDYRVRFASDWVSNQPLPLLPNQLRPVYIAFGPDGNLSYVWANERGIPGASSYSGNLTRIDATQDIFLHIGKIDQVVMPVDTDPAILGRNKFAFDALNASGVKQNLSDLNSYIVRLSPKSGSITASPAVSIDTQIGILGLNPNDLSLGDLIELSRRGTYSTNVTSQ